MLMSTFMKRGHQLSNSMMNFRRFSLVSASQLGSVKREDVIGATDTKWIGSFAKAVVENGD